MITDINKLQQDIRAIGSVSDSAEFFEGFLRALIFLFQRLIDSNPHPHMM